jgi:hypothetical protein
MVEGGYIIRDGAGLRNGNPYDRFSRKDRRHRVTSP